MRAVGERDPPFQRTKGGQGQTAPLPAPPTFQEAAPLPWLTHLDQKGTLRTKCVDAFYYPE